MTKLLSLAAVIGVSFFCVAAVGDAARAARTGRSQSDNSGRRWLWTWLSPWPIWRLPSQRLLRRRLLRRRV